MIVEQIDFIDIKNAAVRFREDARLKLLPAMPDRRLDIERAHDAILRRTDGKLHDAHGDALLLHACARCSLPAAIVAKELRRRRVTAACTARHRPHGGQQSSGGAHGGRLRRPLLALNQHAA